MCVHGYQSVEPVAVMTIPGIELRIGAGEAPDLRLVLLNQPKNVALVRRVLGGLAEVLKLSEDQAIDINAAVSEACNNVVLHAYGNAEGLMEVYVCPEEESLEIVVRDEGGGIQPHAADSQEVEGVGLSLIQALTDRAAFSGGARQGTEVRMAFDLGREIELSAGADCDGEKQVTSPPGQVVFAVAAGPLLAPTLGRLMAMLAARSDFSLEAVSDVQLVSDAVAAHAPEAIVGRHVHVGIDAEDRRLLLRVGPLERGGARKMIEASALGGMEPLLEQLPQGTAVEDAPDGEILTLALADGS
jgi:anti-sigma regulatory factor (Ser/Thr protein kinase)